MNGQPLSFAAASYSRAVPEPISSDDCESVKMKVMSGPDAMASFRAELRYNVHVPVRKTIDRWLCSSVTCYFLPHRVILRHPSFVSPGNRVDEAMVVDESR